MDLKFQVTETDKQIIKTIGPLLVVIIIFIFAGKLIIVQITNVMKKISDENKIKSVLTEKLKTLTSFSMSSSGFADIALAAMPKSNPSLPVMYQLKILSSKYQLVLSNLKASVDENITNIMSLNSSFEVTGAKEQVFLFIRAINTIAPMTFVQKVDFNESVGVYKATIATKTYFAPLPTKVPAVTQAITDLSSTEKALLSQIASLSRLIVSGIGSPTPSSVNPNPFGQ